MSFDFNSQLQEYIGLIDRRLEDYLQISYPEVIYESARYSIFSGGKRVRPAILLGVCDMLNGLRENALPFACALEMIHTYSLIHDDLPALDNDDFRRDKPTNHIVFGEDMALLAGDALLNRAYEVMSDFCINNNENSLHFLKSMSKIASYAGITGMIGGQVMDVRLENSPATADEVAYIYKNKTSKLFMAAFGCGALVAGCGDNTVSIMEKIGFDLGLAFQLKDDFLDLEGDQKLGKATYASVLGIDVAKKMHDDISVSAISSLLKFDNSAFMVSMAENLLHRTR